MSAVRPEDREAAISAIQTEAGGLFRVYFFSAPDGLLLTVGVAAGDQWAIDMLATLNDCADHITAASEHAPALCLTCPAPLRALSGLTFCVVSPEVGRPRYALGSAVCSVCAGLPDLEKRAIVALRQIWPGLREVSVMPGPGTVQ